MMLYMLVESGEEGEEELWRGNFLHGKQVNR
jgi:hypothetical protein